MITVRTILKGVHDADKFSELCRMCGCMKNSFISLFGLYLTPYHDIFNLHFQDFQVSKTDTLPLKLCCDCADKLMSWHTFYNSCVDINQALTSVVHKFKEPNTPQSNEPKDRINGKAIQMATDENKSDNKMDAEAIEIATDEDKSQNEMDATIIQKATDEDKFENEMDAKVDEAILVKIENERDFLMVLEKDAENIASIIGGINDKEKLPPLKVKENALALLFYENMWYRVKITNVMPGKKNIEALFIDSGNVVAIEVNEKNLKKLPHPLDQIPPLVEQSNEPKDRINGKAIQMATDENKSDNKMDAEAIEIATDEDKFENEMDAKVDETKFSIFNDNFNHRKIPPKYVNMILFHAILVKIENERDFLMVLEKDAENIASIIGGINDKEKLPPLKVKENALALLFYENMWYRVKITNVMPGKKNIEALFIDSGYVVAIKVNKKNLKKLPHPLDQIPPLKAVLVRLWNATIESQCLKIGDQIALKVHGVDSDGVSLVTIENDIICTSLEEDLSLEEVLKSYGLDEALAQKFDELSELGLLKFHQSRNDADDNNTTIVSKVVVTGNSRYELKIYSTDKFMELREKISRQKKDLQEKNKQINKVDFNNLLNFAVHSLGFAYVSIRHEHMLNMLLASTYVTKLVQTEIDFGTLTDLRRILNRKLSKDHLFRIRREKLVPLNKFLWFLNESLACSESNSESNIIHTASAVMLNFTAISLFEENVNKQISLLLFNLVLKKHNFPMITFPMELNERLNEVTQEALKCSEYTDYVALIYKCCFKSLETYSKELKEEIESEQNQE